MEGVVKYFNTIEASFKRTRLLVISVVVMAVVISLGSLIYAGQFVVKLGSRVYLVDREGGAFTATSSFEGSLVDIESKDHIKRFHELMFNLIPVHDANMRNINSALYMSDRSAYEFFNDQQESGYYTRLEAGNITQYIVIDSIKVNLNSYPYAERTYGKVFVQRPSNLSAYDFESSGRIVNVGRSEENPHGLMLERFALVRYELIETRSRK